MKSTEKNKRFLWIFKLEDLRFFIAAFLIIMLFPWPATALITDIGISDYPLDTQINPSSPNLMIGLDDSGSMDYETLTDEEETRFYVPGTSKGCEYIFDDPGDNLYTSGTFSDILTGSERLYWRSQYSGYNYMYYNPSTEYKPWVGMTNANVNTPRSHPYYDDYKVNLDSTYYLMGSIAATSTIDERGNTDTSKTGTWNTTDYNKFYYSRTEGSTFSWRPALSDAYYEVSVYFENAWGDNNDSTAEYTIKHASGESVVIIDQGANPTEWISLGAYKFSGAAGEGVTLKRTRTGTYYPTIADKVKFDKYSSTSILINNAHYYVWSISQNRPWLVLLNGSPIKYYSATVDSAATGKVTSLTPGTPPSDVTDQIKSGGDYGKERQNFANWFSFYRRRSLTATAAITNIIPKMKGVNVGVRSINGDLKQAVLHIGTTDENINTLLNIFQSYRKDRHAETATPLRLGLEKIGRYYDTQQSISPSEPMFDVSPLDSGEGGACQQNFAIMFTDGSDSGGAAGFGNTDKPYPAPYGDNASGTLADIAMYYYITDLDHNSANNSLPGAGTDTARNQHMVTYTVGFGVVGNLDPDDYDLTNMDETKRVYPTWPSPINTTKDKIDDLWHAAVNGRGMYLNSKTPETLIEAFQKVTDDILAKIGSGASVAINGEELTANSIIFQSSYATAGWTGDVRAYHALATGRGSLVWGTDGDPDYMRGANERLRGRTASSRIILTYDGSATTKKKNFVFESLSDRQKSALMMTATSTTSDVTDLVNYLRGDASKEESTGEFRARPLKDKDGKLIKDSTGKVLHSKLGDIVHSAPVYKEYTKEGGSKEGVVFAGGNDGMLHAFRESTGDELFAYIPNLLFANLKEIAKPTYGHKFYVDSTPFVKDIGTTAAPKTLLVGGLGKGGKGIYCLDVTKPFENLNNADAAASAIVKWEYPNPSDGDSTSDTNYSDDYNYAGDDDIGYSFSKPVVVKIGSKTNKGDGTFNVNTRWVVIFGNGYNSKNGTAVLYVLDADTGALLTKINTNVGGDDSIFPYKNGLSTPNVVDVDADGIADYAYAGDLRGNLWKFSLKISDPFPESADFSSMKVSYADGTTPKPLFTAVGPDSGGSVQSITSRPDAMLHCDQTLPGYLVVFGTGRYLDEEDIGTTYKQTIYGIWDYGEDKDSTEYLGTFSRSTGKVDNSNVNKSILVPQFATDVYPIVLNPETGEEEYGSTKLRVLTKNPVYWAAQSDPDDPNDPNDPNDTYDQYNPLQGDSPSNVGWFIDLPISGERLIQDIMIRDGDVIAASTIPDPSDPCAAGGSSVFMEFEACTGGRSNKPKFDINGDGKIDDNDLATVMVNGERVSIPPSGVHFPSMVFPPMIVRAGDGSEIKYLSTAAGDVSIVREVAEKRGIFYWRYYKK